jgi:polysaccharide export outer membrane protein
VQIPVNITRRCLGQLLWGLGLLTCGCQTDLDFLTVPRSVFGIKPSGPAPQYTEEAQDRGRRPWQAADSATVGSQQGAGAAAMPKVVQAAYTLQEHGCIERTSLSQPRIPLWQPRPIVMEKVSATEATFNVIVESPPATVAQSPIDCAAKEPEPVCDKCRLPTELTMESHPPYRIEPPDVLWIDTIQMIPRSPYTVQALDVLLLRATGTLPNQPIEGAYTVTPDGRVNLGFSYGSCQVRGLSLDQVEQTIRTHLSKTLGNPQIAISLGQFHGVQQVHGEHLVKADGTISLGTYGTVYVSGMTLEQAKTAVEAHLRKYISEPQVSVDVFAFNSKAYYVIADGGGYGQIVLRLPITGKETVLDAIGQIQGLPAVSSQKRIWVARPAPAGHGCLQVLPVDWRAIVEGGSTATNYQLFPGDRVYVKADCLITIDNWLAKALAPVERLFGITLLGTATVRTIENKNTTGGFIAFP